MPFFDGHDARIHYLAWEVDSPVAGVVFLHGGGEHAGQYGRLAARLNQADIAVWAIDHRGHGLSGGARGLADGFVGLSADVATLTSIVRKGYPQLPLVLGGHSLGSRVAATVLVEDFSPYAGAFLVGASFQGPSGAPATDNAATLDLSFLGVDADYLEELEKDPLVQLTLPLARPGTPAPRAITDEDLAAITVPVHFIHGTDDALTPLPAVEQALGIIGKSSLTRIEKGRHNVLNDVDQVQAVSAARDFVLEAAGVHV